MQSCLGFQLGFVFILHDSLIKHHCFNSKTTEDNKTDQDCQFDIGCTIALFNACIEADRSVAVIGYSAAYQSYLPKTQPQLPYEIANDGTGNASLLNSMLIFQSLFITQFLTFNY